MFVARETQWHHSKLGMRRAREVTRIDTVPSHHEWICIEFVREELYGGFAICFGGDKDIWYCNVGTVLVEKSRDGASEGGLKLV